MSSLVALALLLAASPAAPREPPSPRSAARAAVKTMLPPRMPAAPARRERTWLPATYSLSRDPGFTPWSTFLSLGDDRLGHWALEGTSLGGGLQCAEAPHGGCVPFAQALLAPVWQPHGTPIGFYSGFELASVATGEGMKVVPGFSAGLRVRPAALALLVRRLRARFD